MRPDGRFAPSPTGPLHLGSLRTALAAWLFARSQNARFLLRIEDLDPGRSRAEHERGQIEDLRGLGIDWDEPPVRQSERSALYTQALDALDARGLLYPCYCTRAEIREAASAPHGPGPEGAYPGTCRELTARERREREATGRRPALRLRAGGALVTFRDRIAGERTVAVDDFIVRRADGVAAYQLAVVVDDAAQGIGEVVRGADLADSTPRQVHLQHLLELPTPAYAHVPLVIGPDGARLAKRHGAGTLSDRAQAPARTLAILAHSLGLARDRDEVASPCELLGEFSPDRIPPEPVMLAAAKHPGSG